MTEILTHRRRSQSLAPHQLGRPKAIQEIAELAIRGQADTRENQAKSKITHGMKPLTSASIHAAHVSLEPISVAGAVGTTILPLALIESPHPRPPPMAVPPYSPAAHVCHQKHLS